MPAAHSTSRFAWTGRVYCAAWALLLACSVCFYGGSPWAEFRHNAPLQPRPNASADMFLEATLGIEQHSSRLLLAFQKMPPGKPVVFFCPKESPQWDLVGQLIWYLAWPRQVQKQAVEPGELETAARALDLEETAGVFFCALRPPPEFKRGWSFGPHLFLVPMIEEK